MFVFGFFLSREISCSYSYSFLPLLALSLSTPKENFCKVPQDCLAWSYRSDQIQKQLSLYNPEILCLEEVDHFEEIKAQLSSKGFDGIFSPKKDSPCLRVADNSGPDGVAMFYKTEKFVLKETVSKYLLEETDKEGKNPLILNVFEHTYSKQIFIIGVTHLKAKKGFEERRKAQSKSAISMIKELACKYESASIIVCGDFNGIPEEPFYKVFLEEGFQSAFVEATGKEPEFTTWKIRPTGETQHTIDYVWQFKEKALKVCGFLDIMSAECVPLERFPAYGQPSDHIPLCFEFQL